MNQLEQLKQFTTVVADTGDFALLKNYAPTDATTNPSLILKAVQKAEYKPLFESVVRAHRGVSVPDIIDHVLVAFGQEILKVIPGRVSTEVDARLSFDMAGTIEKAYKIMNLYEAAGITRERVLIKIASTWEGIKACEVLQTQGIRCNMTLLFGAPQALACAQAKAQLISPFVGRIYDWYKKSTGLEYVGANDPGVQSVSKIYAMYKQQGFATEIMGASFRNTGQIIELAGCDLLTIAPDLLEKLAQNNEPISRKLITEISRAISENATCGDFSLKLDEKSFREQLNQDAMASEKLSEGIRAFVADTEKLETLIAAVE